MLSFRKMLAEAKDDADQEVSDWSAKVEDMITTVVLQIGLSTYFECKLHEGPAARGELTPYDINAPVDERAGREPWAWCSI